MRDECLMPIGRHERQDGIARETRIAGEVDSRVDVAQQPAAEKAHIDMSGFAGRDPPRAHGIEDARAERTRRQPAHALPAGFGIARDRGKRTIRIRLPDLDQRVWHGRAVAIGDAQLEMNATGPSGPDDRTEMLLAPRADVEERPDGLRRGRDKAAGRLTHVRGSNGVDRAPRSTMSQVNASAHSGCVRLMSNVEMSRSRARSSVTDFITGSSG